MFDCIIKEENMFFFFFEFLVDFRKDYNLIYFLFGVDWIVVFSFN